MLFKRITYFLSLIFLSHTSFAHQKYKNIDIYDLENLPIEKQVMYIQNFYEGELIYEIDELLNSEQLRNYLIHEIQLMSEPQPCEICTTIKD